MYQVGENLYDDPNNDGYQTAVKLSVNPEISFPFERDKSAIILTDTYVQRYGGFVADAVGSPHPTLKLQIQGTISITQNTDWVVGIGTEFKKEFIAGDFIYLNNTKYNIIGITNDTSLQLETTYSGVTLSGANAFRAQCYLVNELDFNYLEDGIMQFKKQYATLPNGRIEYSTFGFSFPAFRNLSSETTTPIRTGFNQIVVARESYTYVRTNTPQSDIVISNKFQPIDNLNNNVAFVASDTTPTRTAYELLVANEDYLMASETKVTPWQGNIWQQQNIEVIAK